MGQGGPVALNLVVGPRGADRIEVLRGRLRDAGLHATDVPPHVTMAVVEEVDPAAVAEVFTGPPPPDLQMVHLGTFLGPPGVVFVGVAPTTDLVRFHDRSWTAVARLGRGWDRYRPGCWVPHCTLAMPLGSAEVARVITALADAGLPFPADVSELVVADLETGKTLFSTWA